MAGELIYEGSPDVSKLVEDNEYEDFDSDFERPSRIQRLDDSEATPDETE